MTREEAYETLKTGICLMCAYGCKNMDDCDISYCDIRDAVKTVMEESCEVAVSQQAVIDTIFAECSSTKLDIDFAKVLILQRVIKALPPVQPKILACGEGELDVPDTNVGDTIMKEVFGLIEDVLDTLIEVGNGTTDEMLHEAANKLFRVRDLLKAESEVKNDKR